MKLCECGCDKPVERNKQDKSKWNKFIHGHNARKNHPMKGKKHTEQSRKKMSDSHKGKKWTEAQRKSGVGHIPWNKGLTKEIDKRVKKCADSKKGENNPAKREEVREKISFTLKKFCDTDEGKMLIKKLRIITTTRVKTKEELLKISNSMMGKTKEEMGHKIETCMCIACRAKRGEFADKDFLEKYGTFKSRYPYSLKFNKNFKDKVRALYDYKCPVTGITQEEHIKKYGDKLSVHHWNYDKDEVNPFYFVPVAREINGKANFNKSEWTDLFNGVAEDRWCKLLEEGKKWED